MKIRGAFRLFRFELPFTAGTCVVLGELLALGKLPGAKELLLGFLSVFFISATSLILNDYFDLETDRINSPDRPLPSGLITPREVILLSAAVTTLGLIASFLISFTALLVAALVWAVGFLYNWRFKKAGFRGNLMVSFSVGMTFIFGGVVVGIPFEESVWLFGIMSALINLGEEIAADAMDMEGDRQTGSRSLPVLLGRENSLRISAAIFLLVSVISCVPFFFGWMNWIELIPLLLMDMNIIHSAIKLLDPNLVNRRIYIRRIYLGALAAILFIIIIRLVG
jgi:geranylgeranylglycerol-phosphate geranylgeranyltransferase